MLVTAADFIVNVKIDFDFIYNEVMETYGYNGHESVPPPVILKIMLLFVFYNVRSERELVQTLAEHLDWLWFLDDDTFTCPAGQILKRRKFFKKRQHYEYIASAGT